MSVRPRRVATSPQWVKWSPEPVEQSDLRVVVIASGALSHTFHKLRNLRQHEAAPEEHIYSDDARRWDHRVIDALVRGDHSQVVGEMDEFMKCSDRRATSLTTR